MAKIVVGYDGSVGARCALEWAAAEAERCGAELELVCAWQMPLAEDPLATEVLVHLRSTLEDLAAEAADLVAREYDLAAVRVHVTDSHPSTALIDASREADLVVVGSHGLGLFAGLLLGSVTLDCVTHAACPVVVVPAPTAPNHRQFGGHETAHEPGGTLDPVAGRRGARSSTEEERSTAGDARAVEGAAG